MSTPVDIFHDVTFAVVDAIEHGQNNGVVEHQYKGTEYHIEYRGRRRNKPVVHWSTPEAVRSIVFHPLGHRLVMSGGYMVLGQNTRIMIGLPTAHANLLKLVTIGEYISMEDMVVDAKEMDGTYFGETGLAELHEMNAIICMMGQLLPEGHPLKKIDYLMGSSV